MAFTKKYYVVGPTPFTTTKPNGLEATIYQVVSAAGKKGIAVADVWTEVVKTYISATTKSVSSTIVGMKKRGYIRYFGQVSAAAPAAPKKSVNELAVEYFSKGEELLVAIYQAGIAADVAEDADKAFKRYNQFKTAYIDRLTSNTDKASVLEVTKNERVNAFRLAADRQTEVLKLTYKGE